MRVVVVDFSKDPNCGVDYDGKLSPFQFLV